MLETTMLVTGMRGTIAQILEHLKGMLEHRGNKDIDYMVKHPYIRLIRR